MPLSLPGLGDHGSMWQKGASVSLSDAETQVRPVPRVRSSLCCVKPLRSGGWVFLQPNLAYPRGLRGPCRQGEHEKWWASGNVRWGGMGASHRKLHIPSKDIHMHSFKNTMMAPKYPFAGESVGAKDHSWLFCGSRDGEYESVGALPAE